QHLLHALAHLAVLTGRQAPFLKGLLKLVDRRESHALAGAHSVPKRPDRARSRDARVKLSNRARGGVSGIGEYLMSLGCLLAVELLKILDREDRLAAYLDQPGRSMGLQAQRNGADRADVLSDVLARGAIPASGGASEHSV